MAISSNSMSTKMEIWASSVDDEREMCFLDVRERLLSERGFSEMVRARELKMNFCLAPPKNTTVLMRYRRNFKNKPNTMVY